MPRYAVVLDTSWACNSYDEIVVEAETAAKAKYKAAKCFGGMGGGDFFRCSECGCYIEKTYFANDYNVRYYPNCGARMDATDTNDGGKGGADNA